MNFKRHLERLTGAAQAASALRVADESASQAASTARVEQRALALAELREKMGQILERDRLENKQLYAKIEAIPTALADIAEPVETTQGLVYLRQAQLSAQASYGLQSLAAPSAAHFNVLSDLALQPTLRGVVAERCLFLDTETTGLGTGSGVLPFLVGLGWFQDGGFKTEQLLLGSPEQEPALLHRLQQHLSSFDWLVTFNGKSFDWPLLETRFVLNRMRAPRLVGHLDLLGVARRIHRPSQRPRLARCNLKHLETEVLGFTRQGDIEGSEVAERYLRYLRGADASLLEAVIEHNRLDLVAMAALVNLYGDPEYKLVEKDALGLVQTLKRAGNLELALSLCSGALSRQAALQGTEQATRQPDNELLHLRAQLHLCRGDRPQAITDLVQAVGCASARLRLAKLYEHFAKRPELALEVCMQGTSESEVASQRRKLRLLLKLQRRSAGTRETSSSDAATAATD